MIGDSLLAPWQKLDAINTFILPRVSFHLKNGVVQKGPLNLIGRDINPLNPELNPICYLLALLGAHHFLHVSRIRVKLLTFRLLMSYI